MTSRPEIAREGAYRLAKSMGLSENDAESVSWQAMMLARHHDTAAVIRKTLMIIAEAKKEERLRNSRSYSATLRHKRERERQEKLRRKKEE